MQIVIYINNNKIIPFESIIWGVYLLINKLKESEHLYIDATFHTPKEFLQLLIIMCYDTLLNINISVFYIVMNSKTEKPYDIVFYNINQILFMKNKKKLNLKQLLLIMKKL